MPDTPDKSLYNTSHTLLERVRDPNDEEAWKEFIAIYEQYIYNILRHIRIPENDAKELRQDIIVKLWKKLPELVYDKDRGKFRTWLGTVIRNQANEYFRKNKRQEKYIDKDHDESLLDERSDPKGNFDLDSIIADEWNLYVSNLAWESIKAGFNENTQKVFLLSLEGKDKEEIAEICGIEARSVKSYTHRIRKHLKEKIKRYNEELL